MSTDFCFLRLKSVSVVLIGLISLPSLLSGQSSQKTLLSSTGKELFERKWEPGDQLARGDGLGPLFNARSCVECHFLGGVGGGGTNDTNLQLIAVHRDRIKPGGQQETEFRAASIHPDLPGSTTLVVHQTGLSPSYEIWRYRALGLKVRKNQLTNQDRLRNDRLLTDRSNRSVGFQSFDYRRVPLVSTERNAPALFGIGLIAEIADETLTALAREQRGTEFGISGRVASANVEFQNPVGGIDEWGNDNRGPLKQRIGKFGWKGQTGTISEFVAAACANELGLQTPNHPQPNWHNDSPSRTPANQPDDLTDKQCQALIDFVAGIARPVRINLKSAASPAHAGENVFNEIGCVHCHVRTVGAIDGIYSDLLLHDMGSGLADPMLANLSESMIQEIPVFQEISSALATASSSYYSTIPFNAIDSSRFTSEVDQIIRELSREWKTPPLWGLAASAPYLHDGRAATIHEAIMWHNGEAAGVTRRYLELDSDAKHALIVFLESLVGPNHPAPSVVAKNR